MKMGNVHLIIAEGAFVPAPIRSIIEFRSPKFWMFLRPREMIQISEEWKEILTELERNSWLSVYVLGGIDSGKTTFCRFLVDQLSRQFSVAYVDCDPGQSVIGPPTTVGLLPFPADSEHPALPLLRFVGSTSPRGHMLQILSSVKRLAERGWAAGRKLIFDSSGFVLGSVPQEFQFQIIDLLQPNYIVPIQKKDELEQLLANFPLPKIRRLRVSPAVSKRTPEERRHYRTRAFQKYFQEVALHRMNFRSLGLHGLIPSHPGPSRGENLLIGLCDPENFLVSLGILRSLDWVHKRISFYAPAFDPSKIASIHFGSLYLDPAGQELT